MSATRPRGQLGDGAVLSVSAAVAELGLRESDGAAWLRAQGLVQVIRLPGGRTVERVSWRRVLDALEAGEEPAQVVSRPVRSGVGRSRGLAS